MKRDVKKEEMKEDSRGDKKVPKFLMKGLEIWIGTKVKENAKLVKKVEREFHLYRKT